MDVGINRGRVIIGDWLSAVPHMYVVGVEANHQLASHFENAESLQEYRQRAIIIPAAVSLKSGIATFNRGAGWENVSDVGSLFGWQDAKREAERKKHAGSQQQTVRLIGLSDILRHVAPPKPPLFLWDTLKIDIQGSDVEALISAGEYLENFICVVGEFQFNHYAIPKDVPTDPAPTLKKAGFVMAHNGKNNQIWLNKRFVKEYLADPELFGCHRVYDSRLQSVLLAKAFQKALSVAHTVAV